MEIDWFSISLAFLIILIFAAIFTLLRTMSSPYIQRFEPIVKGQIEEIPDTDECYRLSFQFEGRPFEFLELKHATKENFKKVYNSFLILKARSSTQFTLRLDDVLGTVNAAGVIDEVLAEKVYDNKAFLINGKNYGSFFKDYRVSTNDAQAAEIFLTNAEVVSIFERLKTQFSAYGYLMPLVISKGMVLIDYSLSESLVNELVYNPRNILEHARLMDLLARHIENNAQKTLS